MFVVVTKTGSFTINKFEELPDLFSSTGDNAADVFYTSGKFFKQVFA